MPKHNNTEGVEGSGSTAPHIFNLDIRLVYMVNFTIWQLIYYCIRGWVILELVWT